MDRPRRMADSNGAPEWSRIRVTKRHGHFSRNRRRIPAPRPGSEKALQVKHFIHHRIVNFVLHPLRSTSVLVHMFIMFSYLLYVFGCFCLLCFGMFLNVFE